MTRIGSSGIDQGRPGAVDLPATRRHLRLSLAAIAVLVIAVCVMSAVVHVATT